MTTLYERLIKIIDDHPTKLAVGVDKDEITFSELDDRCNRLVSVLCDFGVEHGDRVVLIADHGIEAVTAFWAILQLGGVTVQLNPKMGDDAIGAVLAECEPKVVLVSDNHRVKAGDTWLAGHTGITLKGLTDPDLWRESRPVESALVSQSTTEDDLAAIVYTSGSTGAPKGVCLTHRNLWTVVDAVIDSLQISPMDSYLMVVPLHYVHGIMQLLIHHLAGAGIHLARDFMFPQQVVKKLQQTGVTGFSGVPFHFNSLIENSDFLKADLPALRWLTVTGGRLDPGHIETIRRARPKTAFQVAYGQTECAPRATALSPSKIDRKMNSVGSPIKGVNVFVLDEDGEVLPQGETGEIVVAGNNIMPGYWRQPGATATVIDAQGRLHTGDVGYFDKEGDLFLVGRKSQMIKSAGERIFPHEIEKVLTGTDGVLEAVVVGVPDRVLGERVEAHVRLDPEIDERSPKALSKELRRLCLEQMPIARAPRSFHFWQEFPCQDNGKVDVLRLARHEGGQPFVGQEHDEAVKAPPAAQLQSQPISKTAS